MNGQLIDLEEYKTSEKDVVIVIKPLIINEKREKFFICRGVNKRGVDFEEYSEIKTSKVKALDIKDKKYFVDQVDLDFINERFEAENAELRSIIKRLKVELDRLYIKEKSNYQELVTPLIFSGAAIAFLFIFVFVCTSF